MDIIFEILSRLTNQKNGAVSESMMDKGIIYKVNYGVALHTIKKIALEYAPDHELAQQLYERDEREAKLAAIFMDDPLAVKAQQLDEWSKDFTNVELAEVACSQLFYKTPYALPYSYEWCISSDMYLQKAGWALIARVSQLTEATNGQVMPYLKLVENADLSQAAIRQAVIHALVKFGMKNEVIRGEVISLVNWLNRQNNNSRLVAQETLAFLTV